MFNIDKIKETSQGLHNGVDFAKVVRELASFGVTRFDVFVINGMATYYGKDDETMQGWPVYEDLLIEEKISRQELEDALKIHQNGASDYQTFSRQLAVSGVEKWVVDLKAMTVKYLDMAGQQLAEESIGD